ncbi:MAG: T9SS type A sorting domain-containing protein, partial [Saprospiraceae bacterium]|nr:T9SS type A sorting domain-containing protein [Saprospiraceae bacterium]
YGLWTYDGSDHATYISDYGSSSANPVETEDGFYFISSYDVGQYWLLKHGGDPGVTINLDNIKTPSSNNIPSIASINGKVLYPNWEDSSGYELWMAEDSPESAQLLKDVNPGTGSAYPLELTKAENLVYFRGGSSGRELWRTDGTEAGTFMVFQIVGTNQIIQPQSLKTLGNKAYFLVRKNSGETEFWTSDGTLAGTLKAADVPTSTNQQDRFEVFFLGSKYIYLANDAQNVGFEWVAIDANTAGTEILFDITTNENYYLVSNGNTRKSILNGEFFFIYLNNSSQEYELWKSDGTAFGTHKIVSLEGPAIAAASTKHLFFLFIQKQGNIELWKSDGNIAGTMLTKDLGHSDFTFYNTTCEATESTVFFRSPFSGPDAPDFPYRSDGTEQGTYPVMGAPAPHLAGSNPVGFVSGPEEAVFFHADSENYFRGVWRTEPSAPFSITRLDTTSQDLYLEVGTPMTVGYKVLWFSNDHTLHVTDASGIIDEIQLPVNFSYFWDYGPGGLVYFVARNSKSIWRTDGTPGGTFEVFAASGNSLLYDLKTAGDSLYFMERFSVPNQPNIHLWSSDGTASGTQVIETVTNSHPIFLQSVENSLVYATYSVNPNASTLYARGFEPVYFPDLYPDDFIGLSITDSQLFVLGRPEYSPTDSFHYSLWTAENAQPNLLREFKAIMGHEYYDLKPQNHLHRLGNSVLMGAGLTENNTELWISDGTSGGTKEVLDLNPSGSSNPNNFVRYNDQLWLFTANDGTEVSWWATNGTGSGTFKVAALATVKDYFVPSISNAYLSGNRLFFSMNDGIVGQEPWVMVLEDSLVVSTLTPLSQANELSIWPNPAKDVFNLSLENQMGKPVWVKITNNAGQVLYQQRHTLPDSGPLTIRLPQQSTGIHFLQAMSENGKIWTKKLIIAE